LLGCRRRIRSRWFWHGPDALLGFAALEIFTQGRRQTLFSPQGLIRHWTIHNPLQPVSAPPDPPLPDRGDSTGAIMIKSLSRSPDPDKCRDHVPLLPSPEAACRMMPKWPPLARSNRIGGHHS